MVKSFVARACRWLLRHVESCDKADMTAAEKSRSVWEHESQFLKCLDDLTELTSPAPQSDPVKIIWQFWWQGESEAPLIVKRCMESVRRMCNGYKIVLVDKNNLETYVKLPDHISARFKGREASAHFSDYIRFSLLEKYGGVWLDATEYLTGPIPKDICNSVFFVNTSCYWKTFQDEIPSERIICALDGVAYPNNDYLVGNTGIVAARKGSRTVKAIKYLLECYWRDTAVASTYLFIQYFQTLVIWHNEFCREEYRAMPKHDYCTPNILRARIAEVVEPAFIGSVKALTFMHKLSYKHLVGVPLALPDGRETLLGRILNGEQL